MTTTEERRQALFDALESRILVIDGPMGTMLQQQQLTAADVSALVFHHPDCAYFTASEETEAVMV